MWFDSFQPASDIPHFKPSKSVHIMILPVRASVTLNVVIHTVIQQRDRIHVALCVVRHLSWVVFCILFCSGGRAKEELGFGGGHRKRILPSQKGGSDTAAVPFTHLDRVTAAVPFTQIDRVVLGLLYQMDELLIILCTVDSASQLLPLKQHLKLTFSQQDTDWCVCVCLHVCVCVCVCVHVPDWCVFGACEYCSCEKGCLMNVSYNYYPWRWTHCFARYMAGNATELNILAVNKGKLMQDYSCKLCTIAVTRIVP